MKALRWKRGDFIAQEGVSPLGKLIEVRPAIVVEDSRRYLALYFPLGSTFLSGDWMGGRKRYNLPLTERVDEFVSPTPLRLEERSNGSRHVLSLMPPHAMHAVWFFWDADWRTTELFVNLQAPYERTRAGIRVIDYYLDIAISPDLSWRWKDVDEFEAVCERGVFTPEQRTEIWAEAERTAARVSARAAPFCEGWELWRPDPAWPLPEVPDMPDRR